MTISSGYCSRTDTENWISSNASWSTTEGDQIDLCVEAASRAIDLYCRRDAGSFVVTSTSTRVFTPQSYHEVLIDDIGSASGIVVATDMSGSGNFSTTWLATEYQLEPNNAIAKGFPYNILRTVGAKYFPVFEVAGSWVGVSGQNRSFFAVGDSFGLGMNHQGQATVQITAQWGWPAVPAAIKQATIIQAAMLYEAKGAPAGLMGTPDFGITRFPTGLHPQARMYIEPFVKDGGGLVP